MIRKLFIALVLLCSSALAENLYVRPNGGTYGSEDGSSWDNAFDGFSDVVWGSSAGQLGAGDTLWIAGGTYTQQVTIGGSGSSGSPITIKRATASDSECTGAAGWSSGFDSLVTITTTGYGFTASVARNYITIDGRTEYGIKVNVPDGAGANAVNWDVGCNNWIIKYIECAGPGGTAAYNYSNGIRGIDLTTTSGSSSDTLVSHCSIHGVVTAVYIVSHARFTMEHCKIYDIRSSNVTYHNNILYVQGGESDDGVIRYNEVYNWDAEGIYHAGPSEGVRSGWKIYGNLFHDSSGGGTGRFFEADLRKYDTGYVQDFQFYNNTIVNAWGGLVGADANYVSCVASNNIFWNTSIEIAQGSSVMSRDYNLYDISTTETHGVGSAANPFTDYAGGDFTIGSSSSARNVGVALASEFNTDLAGNTRGSDGTWDIGAYEYAEGGGTGGETGSGGAGAINAQRVNAGQVIKR